MFLRFVLTYLLSFYALLFIGVNAITVEGCENDDIVLSCAAETGTITITNVFYGRMNNDRCVGTRSDVCNKEYSYYICTIY